jgi:SAM-dependent methyltransferase
MARRGWNVTGVDLSREMIEVAQAKAQGFAPDDAASRQFVSGSFSPAPRFLCDDLTTFDLGETWDSATCLYDSLNYILQPEKLQAAFARIAAHVRSGGVFVFDMNSDWAFKADLFTQRNFDPRKNLHYEWRADFDPSSRICSVQMEFRRQIDGRTETFHETHRERAYERHEVEAMLQATGWTLLRAFDAYTMNAPHARSERWYFVARRP